MKILIGAKHSYLVVCLLISLIGCTANQYLVTGEMLDVVGKQFITTGKLYDALFDQGHIDSAQYRPWARFAEKFKLVYKASVDGWVTAQTVQDSKGAAEAVIAIKNELLQFYLAAQAKGKSK